MRRRYCQFLKHTALEWLDRLRVRLNVILFSMIFVGRVVSWEKISGNFPKFIQIFPEISGNLLITYVNQLFPILALQDDVLKMHVLDKQISRSLCFNFMHYVEKKYRVLAWP